MSKEIQRKSAVLPRSFYGKPLIFQSRGVIYEMGERMKGALVFLAVFVIGLVATLAYPTLPFGNQIYHAIGGLDVDYPILGMPVATLVPAVINGVIYGTIVWIIYSVAVSGSRKNK